MRGRFHLGCAALALGVTLSLSVAAEPRLSDQDQATTSIDAIDGLPSRPAPRHKAGPPLNDLDGDGLADGLQAMLAESAPGDKVDVIVTFDGPGNARAARQAVGAFSVRHEYRLIRGFAARMTAAQAGALARVPGVFRVEQDAIAHAFLEAARNDFGVADVHFPPPSDPSGTPYTGAGVDICVVDSGIHASHAEFVVGDGPDNKVIDFKDFVGNILGVIQIDPYDDHMHGTHVASIAAGDGTPFSDDSDADKDLAERLTGVAPSAGLFVAKALRADGAGPVSEIIAAIQWCTDQPSVKVINLSLGVAGSSRGKDSLSRAVNNAVKAGVFVAVAAGNQGAGNYTIGSPGAAQRVLTVGAAADHSADPDLFPDLLWQSLGYYPAQFSSRGPTADNRIKPDIMGPGVTIMAAVPTLFGCQATPDSCYTALSGTSMASPFVAGVAALMLQANPLLTPDEIRQIMFDTAVPRSPTAGKSNETGFGLLDAYAAVKLAEDSNAVYEPTAYPTYSYGSGDLADNNTDIIEFDVDYLESPLAITLTITEGEPACALFFATICLSYYWAPDIEMDLIDPIGILLMSSACPGFGDCGAIGRQETVYVMPTELGTYELRIFPYPNDPNFGAGGTYTYEISQAPLVTGVTPDPDPDPDPDPGGLFADAGPDQEVNYNKKTGQAQVTLDGTGSTGAITSMEWYLVDPVDPVKNVLLDDETLTPTVTLDKAASHTIKLVVGDGGDSHSATMVVTEKLKGGGKPGGKGGGNSAAAR